MLQFAIMLIRKLFQWLALIVLCGSGVLDSATAQTALRTNVSLSIPQARQLAVNALRNNRPRLALQIADGLLQRDPKDSFAHFIIANAAQQLGEPRDGRRAAARAFRLSTTPQDKFTSAQLAARLSYEEQRLTLAQLWLRRSVNYAQNPQQRRQLAMDFQRLRAENPWNTQLRFSIMPSSNVNGGSDSALSIIDGVPFVGIISRDARALSGTAMVADLSTSYRFTTGAKHSAYLTSRLYSRQISLSADAKDNAPNARNRDFSATTLELGLKYVVRAGEHGGLSTIRFNFGKNWYGGDPKSTFARLGLEHSYQTSTRTRLTFSGSYERQDYASTWQAPTATFRLQGSMRHQLEKGGAIRFGVIANNTTSTSVNSTSNSVTAYLSYEMGKPIGPAKISFSAGTTYYDFPSFNFGLISVPGGRQDTSIFASITFAFNKLDYAGFTPTVTLRAQKNRSNISNLDTTQLSATIGIQSSF